MPKLIIREMPTYSPSAGERFIDGGAATWYNIIFGEQVWTAGLFKPYNDPDNEQKWVLSLWENGINPLTVMLIIDIASHFWGFGRSFIIIADNNKHWHKIGLNSIPEEKEMDS